MIEGIVERKLQELGAALNDQLELFANAEKITISLNEIRTTTQDINQASPEKKLGKLYTLCRHIQDIFGDIQPRTDAEKALLQLVALVNSLPSHSKTFTGKD